MSEHQKNLRRHKRISKNSGASDFASKTLFKGGPIRIEVETLNSNGKRAEYVRVVQPDFVVILALSNGNVLLERMYRRGIKKYSYELPAGFIERGETPADAAKRELEEETGFRPSKLKLMFKAYQAPPRISSLIYFYLAEEVVTKKRHLDDLEKLSKLKTFAVSMAKFESMIRNNIIRDQMTLATYLYYRNYLAK